MELRLSIRKTVNTIKQLTGDIKHHLNDTLEALDNSEDRLDKIYNYLDASRVFMNNVENQLNQV